VAKDQLGGAGAWAVILSTAGAGAVVGGIVALRYRPERPLVASIVAVLFVTPETATLALALELASLLAVLTIPAVWRIRRAPIVTRG